MVDATQIILTVSVPTLAVLLGILVNNSRLSNLRALVDSNHASMRLAMADLREMMSARFAEQHTELLRVEQVMDARLKHLEENR